MEYAARARAMAQAAEQGADLMARNDCGRSLLEMILDVAPLSLCERIIQAAEPVGERDQAAILACARRFLDSGSCAQMLEEAFARRQRLHEETLALEAAALMAPSSKPRAM